ncbi:hypothetical protein P3S67_026822 [Capsicum chacoense]
MAKNQIKVEIDLRRMDEQLDKHFARIFGENNKKGFEECSKVEVTKVVEEWELDPKKLKISKFIAEGAYGSVYKGVYDRKQVAVKILDLSDEKRRATVAKAFAQEVSIWNKLGHPNVARLIGASKRLPEVSRNGKRRKWNFVARNHSWEKHRAGYCVVVEYVSGGTLRSHLLKNSIIGRRLSLNAVTKLALDVARGLSYLHSKKVVHRDVKTTNLVLDKEGRVKIIDFGVSRVEASCPTNMSAETGTIGYMAPEVLIGLPYDHKCDVYSFGICLWEIYSCSIPYSGQSPHACSAMYKSRRPEIPNTWPSSLADIMKQCWDDDPKKRPEMQEVVLMLEAIDTQKKSHGCFCFK